MPQVGEAMRRFGLSDSSATLLLVRVGPEVGDWSSAVATLFAGGDVDALPLDRLGAGADLAAVRKVRRALSLIELCSSCADRSTHRPTSSTAIVHCKA